MADAFLTQFPPADIARFYNAVALARSQRTPIEVEARFQLLSASGKTPVQPIPASVFYRMKEYLTINQVQSVTTVSVDAIQGDVRRTEMDRQVTWMVKKRLNMVQSSSLGVRLAVSEETAIRPPQQFRPDYTRTKKRTSYAIYNGIARLDMTRVTDSNRRVSYEVELECTNLDVLKTRFMECATIVWKWLAGSNTLYTLDDLRAVAKELAMATPTPADARDDPLYRFNRDVLVQARNIKREDIVYGGLIGNPDTSYEVTAKADGIRKLMLFTPSGCWAVMPPYEYNRVLTYEAMMQPLVGSWLDGEMIPKERRNANASPPATPYWFLIFDVLRVEGRSVQATPLRTRLTLAKTVADLFIQHKTLRVHAKEFYPIKRVQDLFTTMTSLHQREPTLAYKIDGYMFTPAETPYNARSHELTMEQRLLVAVPDIVKWKPPEELTIDFAVRQGARGIELYSSQKGNRGGVLFLGTDDIPFAGEIQQGSPLLQTIENDTVVEFGWNESEQVLEPRRIRFDKVVGNDIRIAQEVWNDIHNPLPFTALSSENNDTSRLRFALEWEIQKLPIKYVVRPRTIDGFLSNLRVVGKTFIDTWNNSEPALFLQSYPTNVQGEYYVLQDTRNLFDPPPGTIVDTWTVIQPLFGLYEQKESKYFRFTLCSNKPTKALYWPNPILQAVDFRGLDRLKILPPYRTIVDVQYQGNTYIACIPSTWSVKGLPTPESSQPVLPTIVPRDAEPVPDEDVQVIASQAEPLEPEPQLQAVRDLWDLPLPVVRSPAFSLNLPVGTIETLECSWYKEYPIIRIGTIGDGSCLFHSILQGYNPNYQEAESSSRNTYARRIRTAMADFITLKDPEVPDKSFYESAGNGAVATVYSLQVLQELLRSTQYLGDETYALLGLCLGVNIYVVRATGTELYKHITYIHPIRRQWTVVINGTSTHYETVGLRTSEGVQTAFLPEDPFIQAIDTAAPGFV